MSTSGILSLIMGANAIIAQVKYVNNLSLGKAAFESGTSLFRSITSRCSLTMNVAVTVPQLKMSRIYCISGSVKPFRGWCPVG
eukprot:c17980_g1_i1 orf=3-248(-)